MKRKTIAYNCRHAVAALKRSINTDYSNCFHSLEIGEIELDGYTLDKLQEFTELYLFTNVISSLESAEYKLLHTSEVLAPRNSIAYAISGMNALIQAFPTLFSMEYSQYVADNRTIDKVHKRLIRFYQSWAIPSIEEANSLIHQK